MVEPAGGTAPPIGRVATCFVGLTGLASVVIAAVGNFTKQDRATNIAFLIVGISAVVIAPLLSRLQKLKVSATEASADFSIPEAQIKNGQLVAAETVAGIGHESLTEHRTPEEGVADSRTTRPPSTPDLPRVLLTANAVTRLKELGPSDRAAVNQALLDLGAGADTRAVETPGGRSYFVHSAGNVKIYYRQLDKTNPAESDRYVVLDLQADA